MLNCNYGKPSGTSCWQAVSALWVNEEIIWKYRTFSRGKPKGKELFSIENSFQKREYSYVSERSPVLPWSLWGPHTYFPRIMRTLFLCLWAFYDRNHLISLVTQPFNTYLWSASYVSGSIPIIKVRDTNVCTIQWTRKIHKQFQSLVSIIIYNIED